jgi:hypothetical protein
VYRLPKKKPTAAEIELQLSERRFILEAINTAATLLQVPIVTAGVWFYLSRTNPALGALNKAILAAELTPIIGDIQFPEGVLLGAAMESTEDFLDILDKAGLLDKEKIKEAVEETVQDTGDIIADQIIKIIPDQKCEYWLNELNENEPSFGQDLFSRKSLDWFIALKKLKAQGCEQPRTVSDTIWQKA